MYNTCKLNLFRGEMKYNIIGYDLSEESREELTAYEDTYKISFNHASNCDELLACIENLKKVEVFIAIDIDTNRAMKFEIAAELKCFQNVTIIFLSEDLDPEERLRWLNFGALTYIKKPFKAQELVIRTIALTNFKGSNHLSDPNFFIDIQTNKIEFNGRKIKTTPSIYNLIIFLIDNEGKIVTREQIMKEVLDTDDFLTSRNVDTLIKELRKLTTYDVVKTLRGLGYQYNSSIPSLTSSESICDKYPN